MAKNNKYTSINFNHIYEKSITASSNANPPKSPSCSSSLSSSYSAASYSAISAPNKPHGRILVLTRPTPTSTPTPKPKPVPSPAPPPSSSQPQRPIQQPQSAPGSDAISLRPLGRTGTGSSLSSPVLTHDKDKELLPTTQPPISPKPDKFVPPHLRPGFVRREDGPGPEVVRFREATHRQQQQQQQGHAGSPARHVENGRPKSGGYERMRKGGMSEMGMMGRPRSSGSRPRSSGWYVCWST